MLISFLIKRSHYINVQILSKCGFYCRGDFNTALLLSSGYGILEIYTRLGVCLGTVLHCFCCTCLHSFVGTCWGICFSTTLHLGTSISLQRFLETCFVTGEHCCLGTLLQTFLYTFMGTCFSTWVHSWRGTVMHFGTCLQTCLSWQLGGF